MATTEQNSELIIEVSANLDTLRADLKKAKYIAKCTGEEIARALSSSLTKKEVSREVLTLAKNMDTARRSGMAMQKDFESISEGIRKVGEAANFSGKQLEAFSSLQKAMNDTQVQKSFISNLEEIQSLTEATRKKIEQLLTRIGDLQAKDAGDGKKDARDKATGAGDKAKNASDKAKDVGDEAKSAIDGAKKALQDYADEANYMAKSTENVVSKTLNGLEDALVTFATKGKWHFSDLANSILSDLARIGIHQGVSGIFSSLFGSLFGNSGSSSGAGNSDSNSGTGNSAVEEAKKSVEQSKGAIGGARKALQDYADDVDKASEKTEEAVSTTLKGLEDALVTFATKGKWHFSELANSALNDLARIGIHQGVSGIFSSLFDSLFGNSNSSSGSGNSAVEEAKNQGQQSSGGTDQLGSTSDSLQAKKSVEGSTGAVDKARKALQDYADDANKVAKDTEKAVKKTLNGLEDALVTFVTTGKWHFSDLANSIIADFARIAIKQSISGVFSSLFGGLFGNSSSNSGLAGSANVFSGGSWSGAFSYDSFMPSPFSSTSLGGAFSTTALAQYSDTIALSPTAFSFTDSIGLTNKAGAEALMPLSRTGRDNIAVQAMGNDDTFSKVNVNVVVNNNSSSNVTTQQSQDNQGNMTLEVIVQEVDRMLSNNIIQGTSKIGSAMDKTRGLTRARTLYNR